MPYFIKIGYQPKNKSKTTCKGYFISRKSNVVTTKFGAISVQKTIKKKFYWKGMKLPVVNISKFKSSLDAGEFYKTAIHYKLKNGYTQLKEGVKIYKKRV